MTEEQSRAPGQSSVSRPPATVSDQPWPRRQEILLYAGIWVFAFLVRLVYLLQIRDSAMFDLLLGDARTYDGWAQGIAQGHWLGNEVFYQAPLYPYFLGVLYTVFGRHFLLVRLVQMVLGATSCVFIALAGRLFFSRRIGVLAGILLAIYPSAIFFDCLIQKSVLDLFLLSLLLAVLGLLQDQPRGRRWIVAGAILGFLTLSRENALVLVGAIVVWLGVHFRGEPLGHRVKSAALLLAGLAIVLFPVALRNRIVGGEFHLTTAQSGPNLYIGNHRGAYGTYEPLRPGRGDADFERQDATELAEAALGRKLSPAEVSGYWTSRVLAYIREYPGEWLRLMARKWYLTWNRIELGDADDQYTYCDSSSLLRWLTRLFHLGVLGPLGLMGLIVTWDRWRRLWVLYVTLMSYAASVALFFVFARYRFPIVAWLVLFAAAGLVEGFAALQARKFALLAVAALAVLVAGVPANIKPYPEDAFRGIAQYNIGITLVSQKNDIKGAIAHYRLALRIRPDLSAARAGLGAILASQGKTDEAIAELVESVRIQPAIAETRYNLAAALANKGRTDEAIAQYREAVRLLPSLAGAHNDLGSVLLDRGQVDEAVVQLQEAIRLKPDMTYAHYNLARALAAQGKLDEAISQCETAIRLKPDFAEAHYDLGNFLVFRGQLAQAVAHYREALRLKPGNADVYSNLGFALANQGQFAEAIPLYLEALRLRPEKAEAHVNLAIAYAAQARFAEAATHYAEVVRLHPDNSGALDAWARLLATCQDDKVRNPAEAVRLATRACELTGSGDLFKLDTLAAAFAEAGRFPEAVQTAQKAVEIAAAAGNPDLARAIRERLELYKAGKPWRE